MRTDGKGLDRDVAERLLDGVPGAPASAPYLLADLLAAASAPARDAELDGEEAAVAAFHAALSPGDPSPQEAGRAWFPFARLLPVKFAAVALATATAAGGVFVAVQAGALQVDLLQPRPSASGSPAEPSRTDPSPVGSAGTSRPLRTRPNPAVLGMCRSYNAMPPHRRQDALNRPTMQALVSAAGGAAKVGAYCDVLLTHPPGPAEHNHGSSKATPGKDHEDKVKPTPKGRPDKDADDTATSGASESDDDTDDVTDDSDTPSVPNTPDEAERSTTGGTQQETPTTMEESEPEEPSADPDPADS